MSIHYSDNPLRDFENHEAEQEKALEELPKCSCCGDPIQQDYALVINDEWFCTSCQNEYWMKDVEDYGQ